MRTVLITGGATGIGLATAERFAAQGAQLAIAYLDQPASLPALYVKTDLRDPAAIQNLVDTTLLHYGRIDVLVNCASRTGKCAVAPFLETSEALYDEIVDTNLKGTFLLSQAVARHMKEQGGGSIVHVASVGAFAAQELATVYCATKAAQVSLAQSMALELAPFGIRVNAVSPGDINTQASANVVADLKDSGATGQYLRKTPLGRRGRPEEIAAAIVWLASAEASFVTGANLTVDGGFLSY